MRDHQLTGRSTTAALKFVRVARSFCLSLSLSLSLARARRKDECNSGHCALSAAARAAIAATLDFLRAHESAGVFLQQSVDGKILK